MWYLIIFTHSSSDERNRRYARHTARRPTLLIRGQFELFWLNNGRRSLNPCQSNQYVANDQREASTNEELCACGETKTDPNLQANDRIRKYDF